VNATAALMPARLAPGDLARVATVGLRTRRLRAALSALGIAIGVAAIVAVLGLSSSSQAGLLAEIDQLGTNLLTVTSGSNLNGQNVQLPLAAPERIGLLPQVQTVADTGQVPSTNAYRSPLIPTVDTNAIQVQAASLNLPRVLGDNVAQGSYLNSATATEPVAVLGAAAAARLGIDQVNPHERIWVGGQWFYIAGILNPALLAPEIDNSVLIGYPAAERYLNYTATAYRGWAGGHVTAGPPSTIYVRAQTSHVSSVQSLLGNAANPENPSQLNVSQPSAALTARAQAKGALSGLFLGLGAVSLIVGAVGVANIMIISVLERRSEIGLRRALGATRAQIRGQFLTEAILLGLAGGAIGIASGSIATAIYASTKGWAIIIPPLAWGGGIGAAIAIGALAGLLPAIRAARLSPTDALRTV
jgi:putative ABC transport system permease protein